MDRPPTRGQGAPRPLDRFLIWLARFALSVFFRRIEFDGGERLPPGRPLVLVANHVNGLIDPALLLATMPVVPRFLGKSTLWQIRALAPLLDAAGVLPVYRRQDEGVDPAKNAETFARSHAELAAGGSIALFPEGTSHSAPGLLPLKTGAARIALEAEARSGAEALGVAVVPVGLVFDARDRFRSRALVRIGEPIEPRDVAAAAGGALDGPEAVRALTAAIDAGLRAVTLNFVSWEEARLVGRAAAIYARPRLDLPQGSPLADEFELRQAFAAGLAELAERHAERVHAAAETMADYERLRREAGVRDEEVAADWPLPGIARALARTLASLLLRLPAAILGTVLNVVPYKIVGLVARRVRDEPDQLATFKVYPALAVYPAAWIAEAALAGWLAARAAGGWAGAAAAAALLVAAPPTGVVALRFHDRRSRLEADVRGFLRLRTRRGLAAELRRRRDEVHRRVEELVALHREGSRER